MSATAGLVAVNGRTRLSTSPDLEESDAWQRDGVRAHPSSACGAAWPVNKEDEPASIDAMKDGNSMVVTAVSRRGSQATYGYLLSGVTVAPNKMMAEFK